VIDFLTTAGIIHRLEETIDNARKRIVLVSPYLQLSKTIIERLSAADERGVELDLIYGKQEWLKGGEWEAATSIRSLSLHYFENLHAKCYYSERAMIITSMNLYEYSQGNREMGIYVSSRHAVYGKAAAECEQILSNATTRWQGNRPAPENGRAPARSGAASFTPRGVPGTNQNTPKRGKRVSGLNRHQNPGGHCLKCREWIGLNPHIPLCGSCYKRNRSRTKSHSWCHDCGDEWDTSIGAPVCRDCWPQHREVLSGSF